MFYIDLSILIKCFNGDFIFILICSNFGLKGVHYKKFKTINLKFNGFMFLSLI
jgi:hypothetical protein